MSDEIETETKMNILVVWLNIEYGGPDAMRSRGSPVAFCSRSTASKGSLASRSLDVGLGDESAVVVMSLPMIRADIATVVWLRNECAFNNP